MSACNPPPPEADDAAAEASAAPLLASTELREKASLGNAGAEEDVPGFVGVCGRAAAAAAAEE